MTSFFENNFKTHLLLLILITPIEIFVICLMMTGVLCGHHQNVIIDQKHRHHITSPSSVSSISTIIYKLKLKRVWGKKHVEMGESCSLHTSYLIGNQIRQKRFNLTGASHYFLNSKFSRSTARFDGEEGSNMGRICTVASQKQVR